MSASNGRPQSATRRADVDPWMPPMATGSMDAAMHGCRADMEPWMPPSAASADVAGPGAAAAAAQAP